MTSSPYARYVLLCAPLLLGGCDEPAATPAATAPPTQSATGASAVNGAGAGLAGGDVPVARQVHNDPADLAAYRRGLAAAAAGGGGGGGATPHERAEYRRTEQALREMSDEEGMQMLEEMRTAAQHHDEDESPCDRMFNAFAPMSQHAGRDPIVSEEEFRSRCEHMPREMRACFKEEADQTPRETRYCVRLFGAPTPFATGPRSGFGPPPGTPPISPEMRRQLNDAQRRYR